MIRGLVLGVGLSVLLGGAAIAGNLKQIPMDSEFNDGELTWGNGQFKGYQYRWKVVVDAGMIAICGAGYYPDPSSATASRELMATAFVTYNGQKIMKNMSFFTKVKRSGDLKSAMATCQSSGVAAPAGEFSVYLAWPDTRKKF